ncbi:hypothetical protein KUV35_03320 [Marinobacter salsuginis]|uniref:hypothetical protein n=1 Tax=Marinobacter salsuginis TaxID=418719 RepID=UPI001C937E40|nr:hypothetical protein [Marinobacter salsuginis]MBY6070311.1 hypothetical protein [Marinobacter salsuginis]
MESQLHQLEDVLQIPVVQLRSGDYSKMLFSARELLAHSSHCCIVMAANHSSKKLQRLKDLYSCISLMNRLQRQLRKDYLSLNTSIIGVYPSLAYPVCVYEISTVADSYVSGNVLPREGSALFIAVKQLISKLLGVNPAVGGLGLILYKE